MKLEQPTIIDFTNANHDHEDDAGGGLITTAGITPYAVSRGNEYYNAAVFTISNTTEQTIGTVTLITVTLADQILLWASVVITQVAEYTQYSVVHQEPIVFRIRNNSGTQVAWAQSVGVINIQDNEYMPIILVGYDTPDSVGSLSYTLTAQVGTTPSTQSGKVAYRTLMGLVTSV